MNSNHKREPLDETKSAWMQTTLRELDDSARDLDAETLSRLNRARQAALAEFNPLRSKQNIWWQGIGGLALASLLAVAILPSWRTSDVPSVSIPSSNIDASDMELLSSQDQIELYENLEFYAWLEAQESPQG